ncbi:MAG TPA: MBL fold metallo-hydrolase [Cyclobacteriaceae bacterium]|nr:MBL fold metallo-hydrolase [Cyclobacteriaceae bacterium]
MPVFITIPLFFIFLIVLSGFLVSVPGYKGEVSDHFDGREFINPENIQPKGFREIFRWITSRKPGPWIEKTDIGKSIPEARINSSDTIRVTFINHSTFLIQTQGINILTDPIWSNRASPVPWAGPRRMCPPGVDIRALPDIDIILLSHNHYDHLDLPSIKRLQADHRPLIIAPLGIPGFLQRKGIGNTVELDWWQEYEIVENVRIACVPAQHFSGRGMFDRNNTLWCGFVVILPKGNLYFAGDTGYGKFTSAIGEKYSPIRLSILPIGAYQPEWLMKPIHTSPEEAVKIHFDCRAERSIASHFGTFPLGDDGMTQPLTDLENAKIKYNLAPEAFVTLMEGQWRDF